MWPAIPETGARDLGWKDATHLPYLLLLWASNAGSPRPNGHGMWLWILGLGFKPQLLRQPLTLGCHKIHNNDS